MSDLRDDGFGGREPQDGEDGWDDEDEDGEADDGFDDPDAADEADDDSDGGEE